MVSMNTEATVLGTTAAIKRLRAEAKPPAMRLGT
jgi:hypothetical protein